MELNYVTATADDMVAVLVEKYEYDEASLSGKKRHELWRILMDEQADDNIVDEAMDAGEKDAPEMAISPVPYSPEWHDYVMSLFVPEELAEKDGKKHPTTDGMRRVFQMLHQGDGMVEFHSEVVNNGIVGGPIVTFAICTSNGVFSASADATQDNTEFPYSKYLTATADTRAEGRALRRALGLRGVVAAEELASLELPTRTPEGKMNPQQIAFIDVLCKNDQRGMDINVDKLFVAFAHKVPKLATFEDAVLINQKLGKFQNEEEEVPAELKGYDSSWRQGLA